MTLSLFDEPLSLAVAMSRDVGVAGRGATAPLETAEGEDVV